MVKLIMTDIDGTLIPDGTMDINPEYFEVIEKLVEKGIIFVVASGRHMSSVKKVFAPVLDKIWVASQNGNVLTYHGKSRIIKSIPQEWGREMWRQFSKLKGVEGVLDTATEMYCPFEETSMYKILADEYHFNVTGTGGWNQVPEEDFSMMTLYHPQSAENICKELVEDKWKGKLEFLTSGKYWVDIVMPEVGKGTALEEICRQLGIAPEETIAFGDNLNDISMIQSAGKGYAVNTAREETKKAADEVIPGYAENGVLEGWKTFLSITGEETSRANLPSLWPGSKCWMRVQERTFNTPRRKPQIGHIGSVGFVCLPIK